MTPVVPATEPAPDPDRAPLQAWLARLDIARLHKLAVLLAAAIAAREAADRVGTGLRMTFDEDEAVLVLVLSASARPPRCPECQGHD